MSQPVTHQHWSSRFGFILAAVGSAVGLGNIWKFPYIAGENGGGAFVLIYLFFVFLIGAPIMIAEFVIGRAGGKNALGSFKQLEPKKPFWQSIGGLGIITAFCIISFYSVVGGWVIGYIFEAIRFSFASFTTAKDASAHFGNLISNPTWTLMLHGLFMALTAFIVVRGIKKGIEYWCKILLPILALILLVLMIWGLTMPNAYEGLVYLFRPNFSELSWNACLIAMGHAFFTLSVGMGVMITYGSYLHKNINIISTSLTIVLFDTLVAIWAGIAIFCPIFSLGMTPDAGPGLIFHVLPMVFQQIPGGYIFGILFFILLGIAAVSSAISLLEAPVSYLVEEKSFSRKKATLLVSIVAFLIGIPCALSFSSLSEIKWFFNRNFFDFMDYISSNIFLTLGGLGIALFIGFSWKVANAFKELEKGAGHQKGFIKLWGFLIRWVCPIAVGIILIAKLMQF